MFNFWTGGVCINFGCVSIKCEIKWLIISRTFCKLIERLSACSFHARKHNERVLNAVRFETN